MASKALKTAWASIAGNGPVIPFSKVNEKVHLRRNDSGTRRKRNPLVECFFIPRKEPAMPQQMTPDQAKFLLALTLPIIKTEHETTKRVIEAIPLDKGDYRPEPVAKSALELAWHIVAAENRFFGAICTGKFDFTPNNRPDSINNSAKIAAWFDETFNANVKQIEGLSGEQLTKSIDFRGMFQMPAVSFLQLSQNHSIHHRGQLSTYLRPLGAKVPSIYGESYDAAQARAAKEGKAS
jgi:uncharacterized damage-inducible protein DinB